MFTKNGGWPMQVSDTLKPYWNRWLELSPENDCIMWVVELLNPRSSRREYCKSYIKFILVYIARPKAIIHGYMWWPELNRQIEEMTKNCVHC